MFFLLISSDLSSGNNMFMLDASYSYHFFIQKSTKRFGPFHSRHGFLRYFSTCNCINMVVRDTMFKLYHLSLVQTRDVWSVGEVGFFA